MISDRKDIVVHTQRAELSSDKDTIEVEVRSEDLAGAKDHGGVRLFDKEGHIKDVSLDFKDTITNIAGPRDDLWVKKILVKDLPAGMNMTQLRCKGWLEIDKEGGQTERVWDSGPDVDVRQVQVNKLYAMNSDIKPGQCARHPSSVETKWGKLEAMVDTYGFMSGSHTIENHHCLKELRLTDDKGVLAGAESVQALVIPRVRHNDLRQVGEPWNQVPYVERELLDFGEKNLVTLARQADGSYLAQAPEQQAFALERTVKYYQGDDWQFLGIEVALRNPATGEWTKDGDNNFWLGYSEKQVKRTGSGQVNRAASQKPASSVRDVRSGSSATDTVQRLVTAARAYLNANDLEDPAVLALDPDKGEFLISLPNGEFTDWHYEKAIHDLVKATPAAVTLDHSKRFLSVVADQLADGNTKMAVIQSLIDNGLTEFTDAHWDRLVEGVRTNGDVRELPEDMVMGVLYALTETDAKGELLQALQESGCEFTDAHYDGLIAHLARQMILANWPHEPA